MIFVGRFQFLLSTNSNIGNFSQRPTCILCESLARLDKIKYDILFQFSPISVAAFGINNQLNKDWRVQFSSSITPKFHEAQIKFYKIFERCSSQKRTGTLHEIRDPIELYNFYRTYLTKPSIVTQICIFMSFRSLALH
jgi:hypothetical protein